MLERIWCKVTASCNRDIRFLCKGLTQEACEEYVNLKDQIGAHSKLIHEFSSQPGVCTRFLTPGRVVRVQEGATNWGWGIVLTCSAIQRNRSTQVGWPMDQSES